MSVPAKPLAEAFAEGPVVLDGGLSNQLADQGCDLTGPLWSARLIADDLEQIQSAHAAYIEAGARVLITSSYQATYEGFKKHGFSRAETSALLWRSVQAARRAARERTDVWVAASVGPYGAMLADGSEYRGRYGLSVKELELFHRPRIEALAEAEPDVLALETVPDIDEAEALLRVVDGTGMPVWLTYTIEGDTTRAGQPLVDAFALAADTAEVIAVGVNCCVPEDADRAVAVAAEAGKPVAVYPNSGEVWDAAVRDWHGRATFGSARVRDWVAAGARLIGGCCRVGPAEIAELAAALGP
jgi:homocysteine S-methyltransferase